MHGHFHTELSAIPSLTRPADGRFGPKAARLRASVMSSHTPDDLRRAADAVARALRAAS